MPRVSQFFGVIIYDEQIRSTRSRPRGHTACRNDPALFRAVRAAGGTIAWDNGADIDPDVLYYGLTPAWMEESETART